MSENTKEENKDSGTRSPSSDLLCCSFCGKSSDEVTSLIAGPQVQICNECINLCNEIHVDLLKKTREENEKYREALQTIAAQDSGKVGSTKKSDCMATVAQLALRKT